MMLKEIPIDLETMRGAAGEASDLLKSLANPHRLLILCQLTQGERSVGELAAFLDIRDTAVSQHLALLRREGRVSTRREGQTIFYSLADNPSREVLAVLARIYCSPPRGKPGKHQTTRRKP
ncbi:MAG TPA: metalloregulator ArsR/SmtB family transcription factor [Tepidiformaceae bacterium]|nr:metalloregulator ArsR/SmtB family transcription factor [Tepidiformaceae bacterium]